MRSIWGLMKQKEKDDRSKKRSGRVRQSSIQKRKRNVQVEKKGDDIRRWSRSFLPNKDLRCFIYQCHVLC